MDTIYKERANGTWEYWTYAEGRKYFVSRSWAEKQIARGDKLVLVK